MADYPLIDQASLLMVPSATKEGKLYSQLPTDGSGDFTFTRATSATRVNEEGYIEKGYENTLLGSNDWARDDSSYTITGGEAGYDGTNDAWLVNKLAAAYFNKDGLVLAGVMTVSFFAKAGSLDRVFVFIGGDAARFDLTNGEAFSAGGATVSQNIELVSGTTDWYRCSIIINKTGTHNFLIKPQNSSNQDVTGTIYIQDGMLNQGLIAYPYLETTTTPVYGGLQADQPRLDYTDASCPSVLIEPSRTNLIDNSEYFGDWSITEATLTPNDGTSPEGLSNAYSIIETTASNRHRIVRIIGKTATAIDYCFSVFVKNNSGTRNVRLNLESNIASSKASVVFDTSGNVVLAASASGSFANAESFKEQIGDYWKYTLKATSDTGTILIPILLLNDGTTEVYTGNGTSGVYIYGAQLEASSYPTSYIPTYGSTQTRAAETLTATKTLPSEGTLYINVGGTTQPKLLVLGEYFDASTTENKVAIAYSTTALKISHNGSIVVDKTGSYDVSSLTEIDLGHDGGTDQADTSIGEFITFGSFLTTTELNALTQ